MKVKTLVFGLVLMLLAPATQASEFPGIKDLMVQLGNDMTQAQSALLNEDHDGLAKAADAIANHPMAPLGERLRVMARLRTEMSDFKGWDGKTHQAANRLMEAAKAKDRAAETKEFVTILQSCMGCHIAFRDRLKAD